MTDVATYNEGWISVGVSCDEVACLPAAWTSLDGVTWERRWLGETNARPASVAVFDGTLIAVGHAYLNNSAVAAVWTSSDGVEWLRVEHDPLLFGTGQPTGELWDVTMTSVAYVCFEQSRCEFTAVGWTISDSSGQNGEQRARIWSSSDGFTWTVFFDAPSEGVAWDVATNGDVIVATGTAIWRSDDGTTWVQVAPGGSQTSNAIAVGPSYWVSIPGYGDDVWVSPPAD